ncbi:MAG: THUMP domain-containing protein [archaeon]
MKYVAVTMKGAEDLACKEVKSPCKRIYDGHMLFEAKDLKGFSPRLVNRVYSYLGHFRFSSLQDLISKSSKLKFSLKGSFVVRCFRQGQHDFNSKIIEKDVGEVIYKKGFKVNLKNPDNTVIVDIVDDNCCIGLLAMNDLCKRSYRIKSFSASINACLAAAAIKFSGVKKSSIVVDPFCKDGVIPIEASLVGCKSAVGLDESANNIRAAKINAKLANAKVKFVKSNVDSLDMKVDENSVDFIITCPPFISKRKKQAAIESVYREFFHQARNMLKDSGSLTLISHKPELLLVCAKRAGFKPVKEREIFVSNMYYKVVIFRKI